ncbi:hypothetical protein AUI06_08435 [archaeon 13_2_20CM_2_52_21]|nr:MAG: hypothetical protein AUI06_08435 [archaeon 13_2_20CM_2_52_21]
MPKLFLLQSDPDIEAYQLLLLHSPFSANSGQSQAVILTLNLSCRVQTEGGPITNVKDFVQLVKKEQTHPTPSISVREINV